MLRSPSKWRVCWPRMSMNTMATRGSWCIIMPHPSCDQVRLYPTMRPNFSIKGRKPGRARNARVLKKAYTARQCYVKVNKSERTEEKDLR